LLQRTPPVRIHIHPDHVLPFLIVNTDVIMVGYLRAQSPPRPKEEMHYFIGYAVA
jgi:hypothetical protein